MTRSLLIIYFLIPIFCAYAQNTVYTTKSYRTQPVSSEPPKIDGLLDDEAWQQMPWGGGDFVQRFPDNGAKPSVQTYFKILYDDKNLYIAFKNIDPEPDKIVQRMSRRDGFEGDFIEIDIDSYFDKRTAFTFTVSASGVKGDQYVSNDGNNWDPNWDPIWYVKTSINTEGWIAEMRIPLSQLRFADKPEHIWGMQMTRMFFRNQERSNWQPVEQGVAGWVHLFGHLTGVTGIKSQKQLEVQPYILAKTSHYQKEVGNPFAPGSSSSISVGLDAKIGITSDITLDLSVNPDFGQVEADPSQVNLSAFRLFFKEQRPFFIEGGNILTFPLVSFNANNLFYSRRVGRPPQRIIETDPDNDDGVDEYVKTPAHSSILGAAKITGKNKHGFSWGILESVTNEEWAEIDSAGVRSQEVVEPLTNYFVASMQQDINEGKTVVGATFTSANRKIAHENLDFLHKNAQSGGVSFRHSWKDRKYYLQGKGLWSSVKGTPTAITETQRASERYFQRPDNNHADVMSNRTSLSGSAGSLIYGKANGKWVYDIGTLFLSPELELNDIGFLSQTDIISQWVWTQYRILHPVGIFRSMRYNFIQYTDWDFDLTNLARGYELNGNWDLRNFWSLSLGSQLETFRISNADLRGGPAILYPGSLNGWISFSSDSRKKLSGSINLSRNKGFEGYKEWRQLGLTLKYVPTNALNISLSPNISSYQSQLQYIDTRQYHGENRYLVATINQLTVLASLRVTYMLTPNLSIQYWGQPFGSAGSFQNFKFITQAKHERYEQRFATLQKDQIQLNADTEMYTVDENRSGSTDYEFENPNFNLAQYRSNMVLRWEYTPGSTVFVVWTQEMNGEFANDFAPPKEPYRFNFQEKAKNTFLIKFTYRFIH